jgi:hypothetical protein
MATKQAVGKALYIELRRETETSQLILTPQLKNPLKDSLVKPYIISRHMTNLTKRKGWRYTSGPRVPLLDKTGDTLRAIEMVSPMLKWASPLLNGYQAGGWKVVNKPLFVEMSNDDVIDIIEKKTPAALLRRIMKSRGEAKYPESVLVELPYVTPAPF